VKHVAIGFSSVVFSLTLLLAGVVAAQSAPPRKDIPAIAKAANGAIVTIITANNDKPIAQGTGFLVSGDGVIVTNYHVIETGNVAIVKFPDGTAFPVDGVLAVDKVRDLASIKIHGKIFRTLALGDSDNIQVGEEVVAIGNPLSLESTVSNGIISGVRTSKELGKFLQTTAPISPGSSGGPLFNMRGEVVGINTMYLEGGENLNFAIPVNDTKLLLSHQSAKLQKLPNQGELAPRDAPPSTTVEGPIAQTKKTDETYYIRANRNGIYIIDYRGHQLTAHCREALSWLDGEDKLGRPMTENECMYLKGKIGQHIDEDFMVRGDSELRYRPLAGTETNAQVADILDITDDVSLAGPKHPRPAPKTSPEILKTLRWIQNTLKDDEGKTQYLGTGGTFANHINLITELRGCQVTFVYETWKGEVRKGEEETFHSREQVNLGDLDPTSITSDDSAPEIGGGPVSTVRVHTTDKTPSVNEAGDDRGWEPALVIQTTDLLWELPSPYAERFVKALHRAITLCGGKPSAF
jgi:hypothetical protein